jgi:hypothetical protein
MAEFTSCNQLNRFRIYETYENVLSVIRMFYSSPIGFPNFMRVGSGPPLTIKIPFLHNSLIASIIPNHCFCDSQLVPKDVNTATIAVTLKNSYFAAASLFMGTRFSVSRITANLLRS